MRLCVCVFFFFFKQKTAYEMRISDWSSDVCSSDLGRRVQRAAKPLGHSRPLSLPDTGAISGVQPDWSGEYGNGTILKREQSAPGGNSADTRKDRLRRVSRAGYRRHEALLRTGLRLVVRGLRARLRGFLGTGPGWRTDERRVGKEGG